MTRFVDTYNAIRLAYPYLPAAAFDLTTVGGFDYWLGVRALFGIQPTGEDDPTRIWHEAGHAARAMASEVRNAYDNKGTAGDQILEEFGALIGLAPGALTDGVSPLFRLREEYVADAFMFANVGGIPLYRQTFADCPAIRFRADALRTYFKTMHRPRWV